MQNCLLFSKSSRWKSFAAAAASSAACTNVKKYSKVVGVDTDTHTSTKCIQMGIRHHSLHHFFYGSCSSFKLQMQGLKLPNSRFSSLVVNCVMGWSRSATIVAAYLMMKQGMSSAEALQTIRQSRPIRPNPGFLQQLADHENLLNKKPFW